MSRNHIAMKALPVTIRRCLTNVQQGATSNNWNLYQEYSDLDTGSECQTDTGECQTDTRYVGHFDAAPKRLPRYIDPSGNKI